MVKVHIGWADDNLKQFAGRLERLNTEFPMVLPRIVNQVGNRAKTQVIRGLVKQTGLPRTTIVKAIGEPYLARVNGRLSYEMVTRGGFVRLKYLGAKETPSGVVAKPFGKSQLFPSSFMKGGYFPGRIIKDESKWQGHVFHRLNTAGTRTTYTRSEVRIPVEMTQGATKAAFEKTAGPLLQKRVEAALVKLLK